MVTWLELKAAKPAVFSEAASAYRTTKAVLERQLPVMQGSERDFEGWQGDGGVVLPQVVGSRYALLADLCADMGTAANALQALGKEVKSAQGKLNKALKAVYSKEHGGTVDESGGVKLKNGTDAEAQGYADEISEAVKQATTADNTAKAALATVGGTTARPTTPTTSIPKRGTDVRKVKEWWDSLSDGQQQQYIMLDPGKIGALDGIPAEDRDQANRLVLAKLVNEKRIKLDELKAQGKAGTSEYTELNNRVKALEYLKKRTDPKIEGKDGRQLETFLLLLDPAGLGKAVVAVGDPDKADNVITYVPGTYAKLDDVGKHLNRVDRYVDDASLTDPSKKTAGIFWLGYEAPQSIGDPRSWVRGKDAANPDLAKLAAPDLARFQEGLGVTHETPTKAHHTLLGHSYGGTVVGYAALHAKNTDGTPDTPIAADKIVFVGAPGVGAKSAAELGIDPKNVYATAASGDPITKLSKLKVLGFDVTLPTEAEFGAKRFHSEAIGNTPAEVHSGYWDQKNEFDSRRNIAKIVTGAGDPLTKEYKGPEKSPIEEQISKVYQGRKVEKVADGVYQFKDGKGPVIITIRRTEGLSQPEFGKKAEALVQLGKDGKLSNVSNPAARKGAVPAFRRAEKRRIQAITDPEEKRLAEQQLKTYDVDHKHELQLGGADRRDNLWLLDNDVNQDSGRKLHARLEKVSEHFGKNKKVHVFVERW